MQESKTLHYILGISLVMIAVFVVASLVMINSQADNINTTLAVNNEAPTVFSSYVTAASGPYSLSDGFGGGVITGFTAGGTNVIHVTGQLNDVNGWNDISLADIIIRRSDKQAFAYPSAGCVQDSNDCYRGSTTGGSPLCLLTQDGSSVTRKKFDCTFTFDYWTDATDAGSAQVGTSWVVDVGVTDVGGLTGVVNGQNSKEINSYLGVAYTGPIDFGTMAVLTASTAATNYNQVVTQRANDIQNIQILGTEMSCANSTSIPVSSISFFGATASDLAWGDAGTIPLSTANQLAAIALPVKTAGDETRTIRWNVNVPNVTGPCSGTATETAEAA